MGARYVVGIDLGTTHTVVAYAELVARATAPRPKVFDVPQLVSAREIEPRPLLASCLYAPLPGEVEGDPDWIVGEAARRRGAEVTGRFVASAKSWLSHAAVDRAAPILPWGAPDDEDGAPKKLSPLDASARILAHARDAWNAAHPDAPLAEQHVVLTLPASFDEVARQLTLRAAEQSGLAPTLLEEPTAAFYDALEDRRAVQRLVKEGERTVLVCDVGGGTTDLSLMVVSPSDEEDGFAVRRVAVGRHILLGGDNMDLALAHVAEQRLAWGAGPAKLEPAELSQLVLSCRDAKERIFSGEAAEARVTTLGRGSKLVGGARSATLTKADVDAVVLRGFFPPVTDADVAAPRPRGAIVSFGLPYERDPAITRHVRQFLLRHASDMPRGAPDSILLNGGVFHAEPIASALASAVGAAGRITNRDPDLAVARGAVRFGLARLGLVYRIESGASRGYYVGLAADRGEPGASQTARDAARAVCILPRGAKEGVRHEAAGRTFELVVGRSVRFDLWASDVAKDATGALVTLDPDAFERLPPIVTQIPASGKETSVKVTIDAELLPTGHLELACVEAPQGGGASASARRFRLEFQLRETAKSAGPPPPPLSLAPPSLAPQSRAASVAPSKLGEAEKIADKVFGKKGEASPRETKDVVRDLEKVLGDRLTWTMETCRALADKLLANTGARRRSPAHERIFWMLVGFCVRPGFGDPSDPSRVERAWPLFEGRLGFPNEAHNWQQFFIAWRRMAGGLSEAMQLAVRDAMDPVIAPKEAGLKPPKRIPEHTDELLMMLAALERLPPARRATLGEWIVEKTWTAGDSRLWTAIGRVGARVPLYASVHHVVPTRNVEAWLERLLRLDWSKVPTAPHASVQLARVTGDRARDVSDRLRAEVAKKLGTVSAKPEWIQAVRELVEISDQERAAIMGEGLPIGLRLASG
jgi:molecular chaperone DnaK (HSP70)